MSCAGCIVPWSRRSRSTAWSVIPPRSWWPRTGIPLSCAMSAALPEQWFETLPDEV